MKIRSIAVLAIAASVIIGTAACSRGETGSTGEPGVTSPSANPTGALTGSITVFAAASLRGTFTELAKKFEATHPGVTVTTSFAGSSDLVTQITAGAPADVFASADTKNMAKLTTASLIDGSPADFATNVLEIAVPPSNPAAIRTFADLARAGVRTVICAPQVPCGSATVAVERATGVMLTPVSEESSVTDVLGKVSSGEADAGLVYQTDVRAAGSSVTGITFAESGTAVNTLTVAALRTNTNARLASAFIGYVTGPVGRSVLRSAGFGTP